MKCRHCHHELQHVFLDLGFAPPSNAYLKKEDLNCGETHYPLKLYICERCYLVQTQDYIQAEHLFSDDYAYFSSTSTTWLNHAKQYTAMITDRLNLDEESYVIEIASNDGYLLKNFVAANIPCLGIEPTDSTAEAAKKQNIPVLKQFFNEALGQELAANQQQADLIIGNNVYAHVPDINDFTTGMKAALKPQGTISLEFPHLMRLIKEKQFDTVYHEHFSYLSLHAVHNIFTVAGLRIYDVEELPTHGGSLRVYGCHAASYHSDTKNVHDLLEKEKQAGLTEIPTYLKFQSEAETIKNELLRFLLEQKQKGKQVIAYGAAAKGNTLLNYAGITPDLLTCVVDAAPSKQGKFLPGSHIPIYSLEVLNQLKPDWLLILPWNLKEEIVNQLKFIKTNSGQFLVAIPKIDILM